MTDDIKEIIIQTYEILEVIGKGSYGCVSKAKVIKTGKIVALKIIQLET
jgi:serine/threonine protein kinase